MRSPIFVAGFGLSLTAVAVAEGVAFAQPSQPVCEWRIIGRDFGPPEGCGNEPGQHPRGTVITSLSTGGTIAQVTSAIILSDPEHVVLDQLPIAHSKSLG
jgi:hypothetical protein